MPPSKSGTIESHADHLAEIQTHLAAGSICVGVNVVLTKEQALLEGDELRTVIDAKIRESGDVIRAAVLRTVEAMRLKTEAE